MSRNHKAETLDHDGPKLIADGESGTLDHDGPKMEADREAETSDHNGPKMEADGKSETPDHGGPKLIADRESGTLDHDGPKLKTWEEADMENKEKPLGAGIEERVTDKEQLPETGSCIFFDEKGKRMNTDKMFLVIAEKPSVSLAIAHVLGKYEKMNGYVQGKGFICSWCLGHLAEYAVPEAYDPISFPFNLVSLPLPIGDGSRPSLLGLRP